MTCAIPPIDQTSARVGRGYGPGWNRERTSDDQLHAGMDFVADSGAPVLAPLPGRVLFVSDNSGPRISATQAMAGSRGQVRRMGGYGNSVVLEHDLDVPGLPRPFWTSYNHLQAPATLTPGQSVNTGDLLGRVGNTTNNQFRGMGAHLHMEVRRAAFPGPVGRDSYELDTVDPSVLFAALGIDWVDSHREVGRGVGGQLLIRAGGPSDCPTTLSGIGRPLCCGRRARPCPHGWMGGPCLRCARAGLGVLPSGSASTGTHVLPERVRAKYATKGTTTKSVSETSAALLPPDYPEAVDEAAQPTNVLPWVAGGVVVALIGAALWKKQRNRSGLGMQPRDPYAHDIRDLVRDYQLLANDMREEATRP